MNPKDREQRALDLKLNLERGQALSRTNIRVMNLPQENNGKDFAIAMMLSVFRQCFGFGGIAMIVANGEARFVQEAKIAFKGRGDSFQESNYREMFRRMEAIVRPVGGN